MFLKSKDNSRRGCERAGREAANFQQGLLRLPAELRLEIYRYIFLTNENCNLKQGSYWLRGGFPPILHVCRRIRAEVIPIFCGNSMATVHLRDIALKKSMFKQKGFYDILDDRSVACLRWIRIKYHSECSDHGPWNFGNVAILVDRATGRVSVDSQSSFVSREASHERCQDAWLAYIERLIEEIKIRNLNTWSHTLRKVDFQELAKLRESRPCQPKASRRMVHW